MAARAKPGIIADMSRYMNRIIEINSEEWDGAGRGGVIKDQLIRR